MGRITVLYGAVCPSITPSVLPSVRLFAPKNIEGMVRFAAANMGIVFKVFQVYADQPMRKVIQKNIIVWDYINEAICYHHDSSP